MSREGRGGGVLGYRLLPREVAVIMFGSQFDTFNVRDVCEHAVDGMTKRGALTLLVRLAQRGLLEEAERPSEGMAAQWNHYRLTRVGRLQAEVLRELYVLDDVHLDVLDSVVTLSGDAGECTINDLRDHTGRASHELWVAVSVLRQHRLIFRYSGRGSSMKHIVPTPSGIAMIRKEYACAG